MKIKVNQVQSKSENLKVMFYDYFTLGCDSAKKLWEGENGKN